MPLTETHGGDLIDYAASYQGIFRNETTMEGIIERLLETASQPMPEGEKEDATYVEDHYYDDDDDDGLQEARLVKEQRSGRGAEIVVAKDILKQMEKQSFLALCVVHRLMKIGSQPNQTLEMCMGREKRAQVQMATKQPDFVTWVEAANAGPVSPRWKHNSVADVTNDEIMEIIGE